MAAIDSFEYQFKDWRKENVTIAPFSSFSSHGTPTYSTGVVTACYMTYEKKLITDSDGQQALTSSQVFIIGTSARTVLDKITLPDGSTPRIQRVDPFYNEKGVIEMTILYCGE
jgi:hypothetical protein